MNIRSANPNDAVAVGRIRAAAWQAAYRDVLPKDYLATLDPEANLDALRAVMASASPAFHVRIAEVDGAAVGFSISGNARHSTDSRIQEVWALNISPDFWRRGLGRLLVEDALERSARVKAARLELWCIKQNSGARRLYEACGFALTELSRTTSSLTGHPLDEVLYAHAFPPFHPGDAQPASPDGRPSCQR